MVVYSLSNNCIQTTVWIKYTGAISPAAIRVRRRVSVGIASGALLTRRRRSRPSSTATLFCLLMLL